MKENNNKYFYIKIKENFFEDPVIMRLESMQDGFQYSSILLKLYLISLKFSGKIMLNENIPLNIKDLSNITRHKIRILDSAIKIFIELKLMEILPDGSMYMLNINNYIGKSSSEADRQRDYQNRINKDRESCKKPNIESNMISNGLPTTELDLYSKEDLNHNLKEDSPERNHYIDLDKIKNKVSYGEFKKIEEQYNLITTSHYPEKDKQIRLSALEIHIGLMMKKYGEELFAPLTK